MKIFKKCTAFFTVVIMVFTIFPTTTFAKSSNAENKVESNIVLFGYFSDDTQESANSYFNENAEELIGIFDGEYGRSFKNFINKISYGKLTINNIIPQYDGTNITASKLNMTLEQAKVGDYDSEIIESLIQSMPSIADKTVDCDNDGIADNVMIVLKTDDTYSSVESGATLVAHRGQYVGNAKINNKGVYNYNIFGTDRVLFEESGLVSHEFLHTLGYADLYRNSGEDSPVYTWSVMGGVTKYPQYPLAYERMYFTNWLDIDEVSESTSLTLDTQDNANGNQAFIIKSPFNDHEIFVVEYRVKPVRDYLEKDSLDYPIGGTGMIVYRVNLNVEGLSNLKGGTGIYVFRPQDGQPGYSSYEKTSVNNAYLPYSGTDGNRNSIGSADMSMGLVDGALTFSDGSNSGIEINNVKLSADKSQVTCDVAIPNKDDYDLWKNLEYSNSYADDIKTVGIDTVDGALYSVSFDNEKIVSRKYSDGVWSDFSPEISDSNVQSINVEHIGNTLYLAYYDMDNSWNEYAKIYKYDLTSDNSWTLIKSIPNAASGMDLGVVNGEMYLTNLTYAPSGYENDVNVSKITGSTVENIGVCATAMVGQPKIADYNGSLCVAYRNAIGNIINVLQYSESGFNKISNDTLVASYYDIKSSGDELYVALGGSNLSIASYDGSSWQNGTPSNIQCGEPVLSVMNNNIFVLTSPLSDSGNLKMYHYENDEYIQEGENIDASASDITIKTINKDIYLSYVLLNSYQIVIKSKTATQVVEKEVDKSALEASLARAKIHIDGDYSQETKANLLALVDDFTLYLTDTTVTQKEVDAATREILESIYNLSPILYLTLETSNGTFSVNIDDTNSFENQHNVLSGKKVTLNAVSQDGYEFAGWYDTTSNRIMSTNTEYSFVMSTNIHLKAIFVKTESATLTFANSSGFIQSMVTRTTTQWNEYSTIASLLPKVPYSYGYSNGRWDYNDNEVLEKLKAGEDVTLVPFYDADDTSLPPIPEALDVPVLELYYKLDEVNSVGSYVMAAGFPSGIKLESVGIAFYYKNAAQFDPTDNFELLLNNKMTVSSYNIDKTEDIYITNINNLSSRYNWAARGYVTYYDSTNTLKTVYSNQINIINRQMAQ